MVPWAALTGALYPTPVPWAEPCTQSHWSSPSVWSRISARISACRISDLFKKIMILHRRILILLHPSSTDTHFLSSLNSSNHIIWDVLWSVLWTCVFQCFRTPKPPLQSSDNYQTASYQGLLTYITWVQTESTGRGQARVIVVRPATLPQHVILGLTLRRYFINKCSSMHKWTALLYLRHKPVKSSCYQSTFYRWRNWDLESCLSLC